MILMATAMPTSRWLSPRRYPVSPYVVRLLRADWDASGVVTVDTPLQALGSPIEAIRGDLMATEPMNSLLSESTFFLGGGLTVDVLQRNDVVGDVGDGEVALMICFWSWPVGAKRAETVPRTSAATEWLTSMTSWLC